MSKFCEIVDLIRQFTNVLNFKEGGGEITFQKKAFQFFFEKVFELLKMLVLRRKTKHVF